MSELTITAKGQVTLKRDLLRHLGVKPGEKVNVSLKPDGRVEIRAAKPAGSIDGFVGLLAARAKGRLSIEQMNEIAAEGWAGEREDRR